MGTAKTYRWERRQQAKSKAWKLASLDIFDLVILILVFAMSFLSLRLFFMFDVIRAPCAEMFITFGQTGDHAPLFKLTYWISLLMGMYWICVTLGRILNRKSSWPLISWHIIMFISIFFLAVFNRSLTSSNPVIPPDGMMVVERLIPEKTPSSTIWKSKAEPSYQKYKDGIWYAWGDQACVWLDENKISYADLESSRPMVSMKHRLGLGIPHIEILRNMQQYRPLSEIERQRFLDKKACQADITNYGKPREIYGYDRYYPLPKGIGPNLDIYVYGYFDIP